ncbi:MAG: hypothetical protein AAF658_08705 [Myxococcota bacterium]
MLSPALSFSLILALSDLSGIWEIQSLGADRTVRVESSAQKIIVHRVLYPQFEGKKYRLDHLYRGVVDGDSITGKLLVKDDELPDFEVLRPFKGSISNGNLVIDGMPLEKVNDAKGDEVAMLPPAIRTETNKKNNRTRRRRRKGVQSGKTTKKQAAPTLAENDAKEATGADLYDQILGGGGAPDSMFNVSREIDVPDESHEAFDTGRTRFEQKDFEGALKAFERAKELGAGAQVERYRGLSLHALGRHSEALAPLKRALRVDPKDEKVRAAFDEARAKR